MAAVAWLVPLIPAASSLVLAFWGRRLPRQGDWLGIGAVGLSWLLSLGILVDALGGGRAAGAWTWAQFAPAAAGSGSVSVGFLLDPLAAVMLVVVTTVSLAVHVFSAGYMEGDVRYKRYYAMLSFFTFAMLGLVVADNFLLLFIFWELVGLASYVLIGHYYERADARYASIKAFLTTRVGDVAMFAGIMVLFRETGSFHFGTIFQAISAHQVAPATLTLAAVLVFGGAVGKSAQFPLHVWLPDAMAGPTPVSALIHAATMVAAGVYLVARAFGVFVASAEALQVVAWIGGFTALFAATIALVREDIKQVLAYSTVSQLGYMMMGLGVGAYTAGFFHLTTHAFFKALLFLASGSVIYVLHHEQNMHRMGGLARKMPITALTWVVGAAALAGIPPFSGFWSKDEILLAAYHSATPALFWMGLAGAVLTAFYVTRATWMVFFGRPRDQHLYDHAHEAPAVMTWPLVGLAVLAAVAGFWNAPVTHFAFGRFVYFGEPHELPPSGLVTGLAVGGALLGVLGALVIYAWRWIPAEWVVRTLRPVHTLLKHKYYVDEAYHWLFVRGTVALARFLGWFDQVVIDGLVNGAAAFTRGLADGSHFVDQQVIDGTVHLAATSTVAAGNQLRRAQVGYVQAYALTLFVSVVVGLIIFTMGG
ncbi:NADH-quinone oxidoreductase subunit L [Carboxydochorda subterranea]|uniref:NADH-quinone oxidoreductase subunit L n=1 Tax=Carboxydichorda subterranea TaxID=3109565 RepID=A0ABZ1C0H8_9FIRM|nr:NADH-quinone oxidoreductase subunit L [Limnochorda sp. L945t]WRP18594.1 NADH-quinone oxidoreductase subunit L [Limnochorda sp. L945t]